MERVKMFYSYGSDVSKSANEINKWLDENPNIVITKMVQSSSGSSAGSHQTTTTFLYVIKKETIGEISTERSYDSPWK